jgi:hypothetical protein
MTAVYSKTKLSGSANGRGILIPATATPGTVIHTAIAGIVDFSEIWLYAQNNHTASLPLVIEFGGVTSPNDLIQMSIPSKQGLFLIVPGLVLNNGLVVRAYAQTANLISIFGWVNVIDQ